MNAQDAKIMLGATNILLGIQALETKDAVGIQTLLDYLRAAHLRSAHNRTIKRVSAHLTNSDAKRFIRDLYKSFGDGEWFTAQDLMVELDWLPYLKGVDMQQRAIRAGMLLLEQYRLGVLEKTDTAKGVSKSWRIRVPESG